MSDERATDGGSRTRDEAVLPRLGTGDGVVATLAETAAGVQLSALAGGVVAVRDFDPTTLPGRGIAAGEALFGMDSQFVAVDAAARDLTRAGLRSRVLDRGTVYTAVGRVPGGPSTAERRSQ
jgi:hypothetical protein